MQKKNNLFDDSIKSKLDKQRENVPEPQPKDFSVIRLIVVIFVVLFALSIILRIFVR